MSQGLPDVPSFAAAFTDFVEAMAHAAERPESHLAVRIREHLGADPTGLPTRPPSSR